MIIAVPRETHRHEHRVGLTPSAVAHLVRRSHEVLVEKGAGLGARFADPDYQRAGAKIVYGGEEAYQRADLVCAVAGFASRSADALKPDLTVCAFHHLAVARRETVERLMGLGVTLVGSEVIRDPGGELPVLRPISEMAGQMAVHLAAHYLQNEAGGRGILLGNVPGVPPPTVLILGAGAVGCAAARQALAAGAHVIVVDSELRKLRRLTSTVGGQVVTAVAGFTRLERFTAIADVVIGAVLIPGGRAPFLVAREMVEGMKPGSVVIDISIDQGGCVETSRPTTQENPTFVAHGVVHYCVPNLTSNIARTASRALTNAALPYVADLADKGLDGALREDPGLAEGVYLYRGRLVHPTVAAGLGLPVVGLAELLAGAPER